MESLIVVLILLVIAVPVVYFVKMENKRINDLCEVKIGKAVVATEESPVVYQTKETEEVKTSFHLALEEAMKKQELEMEKNEDERERSYIRMKEVERKRKKTVERQVNSRQRNNSEASTVYQDNTAHYVDVASDEISKSNSSSYDSSSSSSSSSFF